MTQCKTCKAILALIETALDGGTPEDIELATKLAERLLSILKTYKESC